MFCVNHQPPSRYHIVIIRATGPRRTLPDRKTISGTSGAQRIDITLVGSAGENVTFRVPAHSLYSDYRVASGEIMMLLCPLPSRTERCGQQLRGTILFQTVFAAPLTFRRSNTANDYVPRVLYSAADINIVP